MGIDGLCMIKLQKLHEVTRLIRCQGFDPLHHSVEIFMVVLKCRLGCAGTAAASCMLQCKSRRCQIACCQCMLCNKSLALEHRVSWCHTATEHNTINQSFIQRVLPHHWEDIFKIFKWRVYSIPLASTSETTSWDLVHQV